MRNFIITACVTTFLLFSTAPNVSSQSEEIYFSTFFGGLGVENASDVALDESDNIFMVGSSDELELDEVSTSFTSPETSLTGNKNVFITKYSSNGDLISKIIIGGSGDDEAGTILFDSHGNIIVTGTTSSPDFPTQGTEFTNETLPSTFLNGIFITKFSRSMEIQWSMVMAGSSNEIFSDAVVDGVNNIIVALSTDSIDFPTLNSNAPNPDNETLFDIVILKLSPSGQILWSEYIFGESQDMALGITIDDTNHIYLTGATRSLDFPGRENQDQSMTQQFVIKLLSTGEFRWAYVGGWIDLYQSRTIVYNRFLEGIVIVGHANFENYPGADPETSETSDEGLSFFTVFDLDGEIRLSTQWGDPFDFPKNIFVSEDGSMYVTGFNSTPRPGQDPLRDAIIARLNVQGKLIENATFGGDGDDIAKALVEDGDGRLIIVGDTSSTDFPLHNPVDSTIGALDAFLTIVEPQFLKPPQAESTSQYRITWTLLPILLVITLLTTFRRTHRPFDQ